MAPVEALQVMLSRLHVNGMTPEFTQDMMIDFLMRRVTGRIAIQEGDPLIDLLTRLKPGEIVDLKFGKYAYGGDGTETTVYDGRAEPIMIRMRPKRTDLLTMRIVFRLLD